MAYRILVADDEQIIREGLPYLLDWEGLDCSIIFTAKDGEEAIRYLKDHPGQIDIAITDIKMPQKDGLDVASYIKQTCPSTQVIILTAYSDFSCAQQAIQYDVTAFVIKSDIEHTLVQAIRKAQACIQEKRREDLTLKTANQMMKKSREAEFESIMRSAAQALHEPSAEDGREQFFVIAYEIHNRTFSESTILEESVRSLLQFSFLPYRTVTCELSERSFCLMLLGNCTPSYVQQQLQSLHTRLGALNLDLLAGVSDSQQRVQDLYRATRQAMHRLNTLDCVKTWFACQESTQQALPTGDFKSLLLLQDFTTFSQRLGEYYRMEKPFETLRMDSIKLLTALSVQHTPMQQGLCDALYIQEIQKAQSIARLKNIMHSYAELCLNSPTLLLEVKHPLVKEIIRYICHTYHEQINLQSIARTFQLSDSYMSRLFHKETGNSLVWVLNEQRVQAAKRLLDNPTLKIFEISNAVGITDATYFSRLFYKHTGITPTEYRRRFEDNKIVQGT